MKEDLGGICSDPISQNSKEGANSRLYQMDGFTAAGGCVCVLFFFSSLYGGGLEGVLESTYSGVNQINKYFSGAYPENTQRSTCIQLPIPQIQPTFFGYTFLSSLYLL